MKTTTLYCTHAVLYLSDPGLRAMIAILEWLRWPEPKIMVSIEDLARLTRGRFNPSSGFVLVMPNSAHVRSPVELCRWIEQQGLTPL